MTGKEIHLDKVLIEACKSGKREAQQQIYQLCSPRLYAVCLRYSGNDHDASDILHDAFIMIFTKIHQYNETGDLMGWMFRITVNTALQWLRKKKKLLFSDDLKGNESPAEFYELSGEKDILKCVQRLPQGYRIVFNMYAVEGYSHAEIAAYLGINESTSRSQYTRARSLLQKALKNNQNILINNPDQNG